MLDAFPGIRLNDMDRDARLRCFIGLWPDAASGRQLGDLALRAQARYGGRAMRAEHMHLTLAFLGDCSVSRLQAVWPELLAASGAVVPFVLNQLGFFAKAGVLWVGPDAAQEQAWQSLQAWHKRFWSILLAHGWKPERHTFRPHFSLLRAAPSLVSPLALDFEPLAISAPKLLLVNSLPSAHASQYQLLATIGRNADV